MQKFKIVVAYDGTDFHGWQVQPKDVTVVSCLQDVFARIFNKEISVLGTSRTDAGVHALGQVATFYTDLPISEAQMLKAWNGGLPKTIHIRSLVKVSDDFNPFANVKQKIYYYHLFLKRPLPHVARFGWLYEFMDSVDIQKFEQCLKIYQGTHDFASFCKLEEEKSTVRTIDEIRLEKLAHWSMLRVVVKSQGFLRFQIRRMVGYALDVARRPHLSVDYLQEVLESKNPQQTLVKASGAGLCLRKVIYHDDKHSQ
ncbi:tRNA pseudouridine(38-40) synthase TruA [Candidatus Babeliales bacterium]|nr:tRNA pseudouridine(38-40) synthase TruA [Candidatus Babeliales bacterium]MBY0353878.1 tRNA pseudouridine(38-40) synthase TruA [Candidatus Babeliales bacterium]